MHIAFVDESQHDTLIDLMHEMCSFYSEEDPASRDDVRSNLLDNLLTPVYSTAVGLLMWGAASVTAGEPSRSVRSTSASSTRCMPL